MPNGPLLRSTMAYIDANPDEHFQLDYAVKRSCGSAGCFATHAILIRFPDAVIQWRPYEGVLLVGVEETAHYVEVDGVTHFIATLAEKILGLDDDQADTLFQEDNSRERLREIVDEYAS